ncbi:MAG TPA: hypothetical protein VN442_11045 [Bryobacteraceae bacterium]|nr:hypothetical protein [Bryobacteraceae bacterium]
MATRKTAVRKLALSLPADVSAKLDHLARVRRSTPAETAAALLRQALGSESFTPGAGKQHADAWKRAFAPLTDDEMLLVDGILLSGPVEQ